MRITTRKVHFEVLKNEGKESIVSDTVRLSGRPQSITKDSQIEKINWQTDYNSYLTL